MEIILIIVEVVMDVKILATESFNKTLRRNSPACLSVKNERGNRNKCLKNKADCIMPSLRFKRDRKSVV